MNPYLIQGPAQISFSGGRSSGMMLCKIVEAHGGTLPTDVTVVFANTGKERAETYDFIERVAEHLGIVIHWIEHEPKEGPQKLGGADKDRWREVTPATASRDGEPFATMIDRLGRVPNVHIRTCTSFLKVHPMMGYQKHTFGDDATVTRGIGLRADEERRLAKARNRTDHNWADVVFPLATAGVTKEDVEAFWKAMPFDLNLPMIGGRTIGGNCDFCFLKPTSELLGLIRKDPHAVDWWAKREANGYLFRQDRPNYAALKIIAMQPQLFDAEEGESLPCECTD